MRLREKGFVAGAMLAGSVAAFAASTGYPAQPGKAGSAVSRATAPVTPAGRTSAEDKVAAEFAFFAGSQGNARSLVTGLRQGSEITLAASAGNSPAGLSAAFTPPTPPMDNGNVRIALALAQEQLIRLGITRPTAGQIEAAFVGGTVTSGHATTRLQGVLQMRAQGTGWGQIANAMGTKLGHVMSGLKQTHRQIAAGQPVPGAGAAGSAGIATAAGTRGRASPSDGETGTGIVTAAGGAAATGARFQAGGDGASVTGQASGSARAEP